MAQQEFQSRFLYLKGGCFIKVNGNIQSIKDSVLQELDNLYDKKYGSRDLVPEELAVTIARISAEINREISVLINRRGVVADISIGDSGTVTLPQVDGRRGTARLSAIRCIHTHKWRGNFVSGRRKHTTEVETGYHDSHRHCGRTAIGDLYGLS